jgi:tripartite motif-containing protein 71
MIYGCDFGNSRIQYSDSTGTSLGHWGGTVSGDGPFVYPLGVAMVPDGTVYMAASGNQRIRVLHDSILRRETATRHSCG